MSDTLHKSISETPRAITGDAPIKSLIAICGHRGHTENAVPELVEFDSCAASMLIVWTCIMVTVISGRVNGVGD